MDKLPIANIKGDKGDPGEVDVSEVQNLISDYLSQVLIEDPDNLGFVIFQKDPSE